MANTRKYYLENREEILIQRKKYYQDNRERKIRESKEYYSENKEKICKRQRIYAVKYREDNKEILVIRRNKYLNTEKGFMVRLWNSIKTSSRKYNRINYPPLFCTKTLTPWSFRFTRELFSR